MLLMCGFFLIHALLCLVNSIVRVVFFGEEDFCPHRCACANILCISKKFYMCVTFNIIMNLLEYIVSFVGL